ncbi:MAG TPA: BatD family protein [Gammaproteobacteria bacterium]|nr:BatD family protein [Gammaproteobacteria bacterium]
MVRRALRVLAAFVALTAALGAAHAQDSVLQATVDRATIRDNESFTYTIRGEGPIREEPDVTSLQKQFDVLGRQSSSRIQILNGQTSQVTEWQYQLMPKADARGELTLPPVRVGNLQTKPVTLRVLPQDTTGNAPADIFMELESQPSTVYVQSQVILTLRLFRNTSVATGRATLTNPEVTGGEAIVEKLGEDAVYQTSRAGRSFEVRERRYAIFPQQAARLMVGPVTYEAMVIPDRGFSRVARFRSGMLEIDVQPAVPPPASMADASWLPAHRVTLTDQWSDDSPDLVVGVPRTRKVTIEADGLLETQLPDLPTTQQAGIRLYADQPEMSRDITPQGFTSRRTVSMAVIAQTAGDVTLAPLRVPWWNVDTQRWEVAELPARTLRIAPSGEPVPAPAPSNAPEATAVTTPPASSFWPAVSAVLAAGWLLTALAWWWSRRVARPAGAARAADAKAKGGKPLRDLDAACRTNDADAARRALLLWAEQRFPDSPPRSLGALAAALPEAPAREVLDLEAHLYGAAPGDWDGGGLRGVLRAFETDSGAGAAVKEDPLLPLYR